MKGENLSVVIDHSALVYIINSKKEPPTLRLKKLLEILSQYSFNIRYLKGKEMYISDFLSRHPGNDTSSPNEMMHDYLDLASTNIIPYRTRGQKQRYEENEMTYANRCSAHIEYIKPNIKVKTQRQKVPDDEYIDMAKIVKDDKPRHDRKRALETERQLQEKEAKRLALAKAK